MFGDRTIVILLSTARANEASRPRSQITMNNSSNISYTSFCSFRVVMQCLSVQTDLKGLLICDEVIPMRRISTVPSYMPIAFCHLQFPKHTITSFHAKLHEAARSSSHPACMCYLFQRQSHPMPVRFEHIFHLD